ncbi:MAG: AEC family transporter [Boseongicola sp.]|nr:AEC family transporter [Boseongicola sp.]
MNAILTVFEIVAPVFLLAGIGFIWVKLGIEYRIRFVTQLAMTLGVPCLIFTALMKTEIDPGALTQLSLATIAAYLIVTIIFFVFVRAFKLDFRTYLAPLIFGNTGNLGLPLALFAFGEIGLGYAVVVFAIMAIISFTFGVWVVSGGASLVTVLKEPIVGATLLGGLFLWQGWETPQFLTNTLDLIGQLAIPLMLITLGVAVARLKPRSFGRVFWISLAKAIICAGVAWGVGSFFPLDKIAFGVLVIQVATPVAVTSYLLAEKYGADSDSVAGLVVVSTLLSVGILPLLLALTL